MIKFKKKIMKWGNSLALRLPTKDLNQANLKEEDEVNIYLLNQNMIITPSSKNIDDKTLNIIEMLLNEN